MVESEPADLPVAKLRDGPGQLKVLGGGREGKQWEEVGVMMGRVMREEVRGDEGRRCRVRGDEGGGEGR